MPDLAKANDPILYCKWDFSFTVVDSLATVRGSVPSNRSVVRERHLDAFPYV